jgi:hypothetical protein
MVQIMKAIPPKIAPRSKDKTGTYFCTRDSIDPKELNLEVMVFVNQVPKLDEAFIPRKSSKAVIVAPMSA